jgi:hypothetical protein
MGKPLARNDEVSPSGRRNFELFADRVIVKAKSARGVGDSVTTVKLANLRPETKVLRGRPKAYGLGLFLLAASIGLGFAAFLVRGLGLLSHDTAMTLMSAATGACHHRVA